MLGVSQVIKCSLCVEVVPGGSLAFMCCKIKSVIDREQKKVVWVAAAALSS